MNIVTFISLYIALLSSIVMIIFLFLLEIDHAFICFIIGLISLLVTWKYWDYNLK